MRNILSEAWLLIKADSSQAEAGVDRTKAKVEELDKSSDGLGKTVSKAQAAFSKLLIPVAVAGAIAGLTSKVIDLATAAQRSKVEFDKIAQSARDIASNARISELSKFEQERINLIKQFEAQAEAARAKAEEFRNTTLGWWQNVFGLGSLDEQLEQALAEIASAEATATQTLNRLVAKLRQEANAQLERESESLQQQLLRAEADLLEAQGKTNEATAKRREAQRLANEAEIAELEELAKQYEETYGTDSIQFQRMREQILALHELQMKLDDIRAKQAAKRYEEEMRSAISRIQQVINDAFGGANISSVSDLANAVQGVVSALYATERRGA
jgi:hypothetical protein